MDCGYITDGYTRPGYIAAREGLYPALRFKFRPMLVATRAIVSREIANLRNKPEKAEGIAAKAIARHVTQWDLENGDGETVPIDEQTAMRLHPSLFNALYLVVIGERPSDSDPTLDDEDREAEAQRRIDAALAEGDGAAAVEQAAAKNSETASG